MKWLLILISYIDRAEEEAVTENIFKSWEIRKQNKGIQNNCSLMG